MARRWWLSLAGAVVAAAVALAGFALGSTCGRVPSWHSGFGYVGDQEASIDVGGWTYGFDDHSIPQWIDRSGTRHSGSWPQCVGPAGTKAWIRFASVSVHAGGSSWRHVVLVDCRGS